MANLCDWNCFDLIILCAQEKIIMTDKNSRTAYGIMGLVLVCCLMMAFIETVIEPAYAVKSGTKAAVFLLLPLLFSKVAKIKLFDRSFVLDQKDIIKLLALGALIYGIILGGYALTADIFDYASLVRSLSADQKVDNNSFIWVALYISFGNSFLEEFLFRYVSFLQLTKYASRKTAYLFSSAAFAVYHIAMLAASFPLPLLLLVLIGLAAGGLIFDYVDEKGGTIYNSWIIHMFADFAIMTIWYLHI